MGAMERNAVKGQRAAIGSLSRVASGGKRLPKPTASRSGQDSAISVRDEHVLESLD
jgi:hypothetical protein